MFAPFTTAKAVAQGTPRQPSHGFDRKASVHSDFTLIELLVVVA
jgi:hypothetical protein